VTLVPVPLDQALRVAAADEQAGRLDEAESLLGTILQTAPGHPEALHTLGLVAFRQGRLDRAAELVERAAAQGADAGLTSRNLCTIYERLGRIDEAIAAGRRAIAANPDDPHAHINLSIACYRALLLDESVALARRAIRLGPDLAAAHFALAEPLLLRAEFAEGWEEYEWRFRLGTQPRMMPPTDRPHWNGAAMPHATLLLVADQGFGDVIQFCRYIPWVFARCPHLAIASSPELGPLLRQIAPRAALVERWQDCPAFAAYCALSGLPRLHGTRLDSIPWPGPYLRADPALAAACAARLDRLLPAGYRRIGIVWAGRAAHPNDGNRSATLRDLLPLTEVPRTALVSLQKGPPQDQAGSYFGAAPLLNAGPELASFADTAAVLDALDLLVTVDTGVAHLAGAMGKPVWMMVPFAPDWRWLLDRMDTPWYPSLRLFRQKLPRRWDAVAAEIAGALAAG
jgi:hypothetical protein